MIIRKEEIPKDLLCFGVVVPTCEHRDILAMSFASEKYPGRVADDETLVRIFMGGAIRPEILERSDSELLEIAWRELQSLLGIRTPPKFQKLVRWTEAMPQYLVGHLQKMDRIQSRLDSFPGLALAGNAYSGVGIPQCIRSGHAAASKIMKQLGLSVMDDRQSPVHNQNLG
jgi:oxygen-dependent protoporphyrinogen oxidase